jgi:prepilin-type N-terminal cleavage/methylation domain-containing protein
MRATKDCRRFGFTIAELIVVIGILGILIALVLPQISQIQPKADQIACMTHLRGLWLAFAPCASEAEGWPSLPDGVKPGTREEENFWLVFSSNNLNLSSNQWHCPTIDRVMRRYPPPVGNAPLIHYLPTLFDSRPGTANKWTGMPWFSEIANVHGGGNLTITAQGNIVPSNPQP